MSQDDNRRDQEVRARSTFPEWGRPCWHTQWSRPAHHLSPCSHSQATWLFSAFQQGTHAGIGAVGITPPKSQEEGLCRELRFLGCPLPVFITGETKEQRTKPALFSASPPPNTRLLFISWQRLSDAGIGGSASRPPSLLEEHNKACPGASELKPPSTPSRALSCPQCCLKALPMSWGGERIFVLHFHSCKSSSPVLHTSSFALSLLWKTVRKSRL